jgi:hypothetical protein
MVRQISVILVCAAAFGTTFAAPADAASTEIQPPDETVGVLIHSGRGGEAYVQLYPDRGFAKLFIRRGQYEPPRGRSAVVVLATEIPKAPLDGRIEVTFGSYGSLSGELVPAGKPKLGEDHPGCRGPRDETEYGHFAGTIDFHGVDGFLATHATRAEVFVRRSAELTCGKGKAKLLEENGYPPDELFSYIYYPRSFFGWTEVLLYAPATDEKFATEFSLVKDQQNQTTKFRAVDYGRVEPGLDFALVAEAGTSKPDALRLSGPEEHPSQITVEPPYPFAGKATFFTRSGRFRGGLKATFPDHIRAPLARPSAEPHACILTPKMLKRVCF